MKKAITILSFLLLLITTDKAFALRFNVYGGYVFNDKFSSFYDTYNYYNGKINGGFQWGLGAEFSFLKVTYVELLYMRQDTHAPTDYATSNTLFMKSDDFLLNINYTMLGAGAHVTVPGTNIQTFGGLMAGAAMLNIQSSLNGESRDVSKFAWGGKLGFTVWATHHIGIKFQGQFLSPSQSVGGSFFFGTSGAGVGLSSTSTIYQASLSGGFVFKIL